MTAQIIGISIDIVLIGILIFFILKTFKIRTKDNKWPKQFLISLIVGVIAIPALLFSLINASIVLATPVPEIFIPSNEVKITGTNTKGTLKGKTTPNTLVTLKEDVDEDPVVKKMYSDNSGKFVFKNLEDSLDYKLSAKNKYHKSKVIKVEVSDIPDSAYTKIHIANEDEFGDTKVDQDANNEAKISGTSAKNAKIRLENGNYDTIKTIYADNKGKWNLTLAGPKDKKTKDYTVYAKVHGLLESLGNDITVKNPNYVKPQKPAKKTKDTSPTSNDDNQQSNATQSNDSTTTDKPKKTTKAPKQSQSEAQQGFTDDMNTYLGNQYPDVSFTYTDGEATFIVPDDVAFLGKNAMKAYVQPLFDRNELFAKANNLKDGSPVFLVKTQSGSYIARTSMLGFKVYADK